MNKLKPNMLLCLDCGHSEKLTKFNDGRRCPTCSGHYVSCYVGIDLSKKELSDNK